MYLTDGDGRVLTDGDGNPIWDGDPPVNITSIDPFLKEIRWHMPELPEHLATERLKDVLREFCRDTFVVYRGFKVLVDYLEPVNNLAVLVPIVDYMPSLIALGVGEVRVNGSVREVKQKILLNSDDPGQGLFYNVTGTTIRVFPFQSVPDDIHLMVAFAPDGEATEYPGELIPHIKGIASGVMADMCAMPKKPWSDPGLAAYHQNRYEAAVSKAKGEWFRNHGKKGTVKWV